MAMTPTEKTKHEMFSQWLVASHEARKPIEWEWFIRKNFVDGNHWVKWDNKTSSIEEVGKKNKFRVTINHIYRIVRAIRNYVTKHKPKWEVMAQDLDNRVYNKAVGAERFLDTYFLEEGLSGKIKDAVGDAMWASVGHAWFWWNSERQWLEWDKVDPFDFHPDPTSKDTLAYSDAKFVFRSFSKKVKDIKNDERFENRDDVVADHKLAASDMKVTLMQMTSGMNLNAWKDAKDLDTAIVYEGYYVNDDNKVNHVMLTATATLIDEPTKFDPMPVRTYHTDTETNRQYTQGWVKNLIPPQKIINTLESQSLEYNHIFGKGRWEMEKGAGVSMIVNKNGQIIQKNRGYHLRQHPMQSQPASVDNQIIRSVRYSEDIGAAHDAFVGRKPGGADSGVAIENLMLGEENNLVDLRDNLEIFLISAAELVLLAFSRYKMDIFTFFIPSPMQEDPEFFAMVGNESPLELEDVELVFNGKPQKVKVERIIERNNIRVTVGSWIGQGKVGGRTELIRMAEAGVIGQQEILEYFNAPNIREIMERTRQEKSMELFMSAAVQQPPGTVPAIEAGQIPAVSAGGTGVAQAPIPSGPPAGGP